MLLAVVLGKPMPKSMSQSQSKSQRTSSPYPAVVLDEPYSHFPGLVRYLLPPKHSLALKQYCLKEHSASEWETREWLACSSPITHPRVILKIQHDLEVQMFLYASHSWA